MAGEGNDNDEPQRLHSEYRQELLARQSSNTESFDRSILSLSSAALGFSISFIKDVVPLNTATHVGLLHASWFLFASSIVATIVSLISSQLAIDKQLIFAELYYLDRKDEFLKKCNPFDRITIWLNRLSGLAFVIGIGLTVTFAVMNTPGGDGTMAKASGDETLVLKGHPVGAMQRVSSGDQGERGQQIGPMPRVTGSNSQTEGSNQSGAGKSTGSSGGDSNKK